MEIKKRIVVAIKVTIISVIFLASLFMVYYTPLISPFLKPFFPARARWTSEEIMEQAKTKNYDKDFLAYFNRDPKRNIPRGKNIVVSPADGIIKIVKTIKERHRIVIYMSFWDVHVQRVPISGKVIDIIDSIHEDQDDFKCENCPQKITNILADIGIIKVKQVTSVFASRINVFLEKGENVQVGDKLGTILLGSHVVIDFPIKAKLFVKKGDRVYGGESIIARY